MAKLKLVVANRKKIMSRGKNVLYYKIHSNVNVYRKDNRYANEIFEGQKGAKDECSDEMIALKHSALFIVTRLVMWKKY